MFFTGGKHAKEGYVGPAKLGRGPSNANCPNCKCMVTTTTSKRMSKCMVGIIVCLCISVM